MAVKKRETDRRGESGGRQTHNLEATLDPEGKTSHCRQGPQGFGHDHVLAQAALESADDGAAHLDGHQVGRQERHVVVLHAVSQGRVFVLLHDIDRQQ